MTSNACHDLAPVVEPTTFDRIRALAFALKELPHGAYLTVCLGDSPEMANELETVANASANVSVHNNKHVHAMVCGVDFHAWRPLTVDEVRARHEREIAEASR